MLNFCQISCGSGGGRRGGDGGGSGGDGGGGGVIPAGEVRDTPE